MCYADLADRLDSIDRDDPRTVLAFPDGSLDRYYAVDGLDGERLTDRERFGRQLASGAGDTFGLEERAVRPGGQAVNAARQAHALGEDVTLVGTLDHPVLAALPFDARSTGEPSLIRVLAFDGEEVLLAERSAAADDWGAEDLAAAIDPAALAGADAVCAGNWASFRGLEEVFERLGASGDGRDPDLRVDGDPPIVLDPGALAPASERDRRDLFEALAAATASADVILSVNRAELAAAAEAVGVDASDGEGADGDALGAVVRDVRESIGIDGVVYHGADVAVGVTRDGVERVEMVEVEAPETTTGAGDRFSAGLACALAREWPPEAALALGNACAAHFVATGETGDAGELASFVR